MLSTTKKNGKRIVASNRRFDENRYMSMLIENVPRPITNKREHQKIVKMIDAMIGNESMTATESAFLDLLVMIAKEWERKIIPPRQKSTPVDVLKFMMEQHGLRNRDLVPLFGSRQIVSDVLHGRRLIGIANAKKLAERFHLSVDLFI